VSISGFGDVTVNTAANIIRISAPVQTDQTVGMYAVGNTTGQSSSTTRDARSISVDGAGIVSVGYSGGSLRISATVAAQTVQSLGMYAVQNTTGQSSSTTMDARTLSVAGDGAVSVGYSAGSLRISAPEQTVESQSIGMSNVGNTSGTTGMASGGQVRFVFAGGNNITLSQSLNGASGTITISAPNLGAGAMSAGVSNLGNSDGATGITGTQLVLVGSNNITLSQTTGANGGTVSILAPASSVLSAVAPLSTSTNGSTISVLGPATSSLVGTNGISISTNGSTISVMQTTGSSVQSSWQAFDGPIVTQAQGQNTVFIAPYRIPDLNFDRAMFGFHITNASNSSNSVTLSLSAGIYTRTGSTLSLLSSIASSTNFTASGTVGSYSLYSGLRYLTIPWTMTLTEGDYYFANLTRTTTGGGAGFTLAQACRSEFTAANITAFGPFGTIPSTFQPVLGRGHFGTTTTQLPASIAFTAIVGTGSAQQREPYVQLRSGTA
jgi:hypothetical protein